MENQATATEQTPTAKPTFKAGDHVVWTTQRRVKREVKAQDFTGRVAAVNGEYLFIDNGAPGKFRQIKSGTMNLRKAGQDHAKAE